MLLAPFIVSDPAFETPPCPEMLALPSMTSVARFRTMPAGPWIGLLKLSSLHGHGALVDHDDRARVRADAGAVIEDEATGVVDPSTSPGA